jgi:hypothetical protein
MAFEAASFIWLTSGPLEHFAQLVTRLGERGLLASKLELDESQLEGLRGVNGLGPLVGEVVQAVEKNDVRALISAIAKAPPGTGQQLNVYFRLQEPARLTGALREGYERTVGEPPPEDKIGLSPIARFEAWAVFALDDVQGTGWVAEANKLGRSLQTRMAIPVWRLLDSPANEKPFSPSAALELRSVIEDAAYVAFALAQVGSWVDDSVVLLRVI